MIVTVPLGSNELVKVMSLVMSILAPSAFADTNSEKLATDVVATAMSAKKVRTTTMHKFNKTEQWHVVDEFGQK